LAAGAVMTTVCNPALPAGWACAALVAQHAMAITTTVGRSGGGAQRQDRAGGLLEGMFMKLAPLGGRALRSPHPPLTPAIERGVGQVQ